MQAGSRVTRMTAFTPLEAQQQSDAGVNGSWVARVSGLVRCVAAAGWVQGVTCIAPRNSADYGTPPASPHAAPRPPSPLLPSLSSPRPPPLPIQPLPPQCSRRPHRATLDPSLQPQTRAILIALRLLFFFFYGIAVSTCHITWYCASSGCCVYFFF